MDPKNTQFAGARRRMLCYRFGPLWIPLRQHASQYDEEEDVSLLSDERISASARAVLSSFESYIHPPVVLGSGQCGEVQEAAAMAHAFCACMQL